MEWEPLLPSLERIMKMGLQSYFEEFNKKIKMDYDQKSELASKRDIILNKLVSDEEIPSFEYFNQGSYAMYTGVEPLDKEYDIDVGLVFNINKDDIKPYDLKKSVYNAVKDHTDYGADIKEPCVTVTYKKNGEEAFHVDLVIYSYEDQDDDESQIYMSRGDENSAADEKIWEKADPCGLIDLINNKFTDENERAQFRRAIRYLKRWKNIKFKQTGTSEPPGIGVTLLAEKLFKPYKYDYLEKKFKADDLQALIDLTNEIKNQFNFVGTSKTGRLLYRITLNLKVEPYSDVFCNMTDSQMTDFKDKIESLYSKLIEVKNETDIIEQCTKLIAIFGDDFPKADKIKESKAQSNYIPPSSTAGAITNE